MSLEYGILGFLSKKDLTGYDIKKAFDIAAGFIWPANQGQIYRTLKQMLQKNWVCIAEISPSIVHDKKTYHITPEGQQAFERWLDGALEENFPRNEALLKLFYYAQADPEKAMANLDRLMAQKRQITAVFDEMTVRRAAEYRQMLALEEDSPEFQTNLFLSQWGYIREKAFLEFLETYKRHYQTLLDKKSPEA